MMLFLILDVMNRVFNGRRTDAEGAITLLPSESLSPRKRFVHDFDEPLLMSCMAFETLCVAFKDKSI